MARNTEGTKPQDNQGTGEGGVLVEQQENTTAAKVNVNANVNFTLFNNPFVAAFEKNNQSMMLLLAPSHTHGRKTTTVGKIIADIKNMLGKGDDDPDIKSLETDMLNNIGNVAKPKGQGGVNGISITIHQAFLYYEKREDGSSKMEYAFSLKIDTSCLFENLNGLFALNSASLSVWNTDRKKILETMQIFGIQDFLEETGEAV